ncbi:MAG: WHG domain-containing protein [Thiothrix sp.]
MRKEKDAYHHGQLAESLLDAVDEIASKFGLEAVTLRACAKLVGVAPSAAFRHYADKRTLMTAFATRALCQLFSRMEQARNEAANQGEQAFPVVAMAYIAFALDKPAFFRAMWREEGIYINDKHYVDASQRLNHYLQRGFANTIADKDPDSLSPQELLAWSSVHGLAGLFVENALGQGLGRAHKLQQARAMVRALEPVFGLSNVLTQSPGSDTSVQSC